MIGGRRPPQDGMGRRPSGTEGPATMSRDAWIAVALSAVLPGLGQLYTGQRAKGISMLCITLGLVFWAAMATVGPAHFRSWFTVLVLAVTYVLVWVPAVTDAYRLTPSTPTSVMSVEKPWYVIFMILATGALAVPLLWQTARFSRRAKYIWSTIAILNTMLALLFLALLGPVIDRVYEDLLGRHAR